MIITFLLAALVLFVVIGLWITVYYIQNPVIENPDGKSKVKGQCGDIMEICLEFDNNRVVNATHWTNGCSHSYSCITTATDLAMGKSPEEIINNIDANIIQEQIGGLPRDHMHCAILAQSSLHEAVENYLAKSYKK